MRPTRCVLRIFVAFVAHAVVCAVSPAPLTPFSSCASMLSYFQSSTLSRSAQAGLQLQRPSSPGLHVRRLRNDSREALKPGPRKRSVFSQTNAEVPGVDQPDIVKTDGSHVFLQYNWDRTVIVLESGPGGAPRVVSVLDLPAMSSEFQGEGMLISAGELLIFATEWLSTKNVDGLFTELRDPAVFVYRVSIADPAAPSLLQTLRISGLFVSASAVDGSVRLVTQEYLPDRTEFEEAVGLSDGPRNLTRPLTAEDWLPSFEISNVSGPVERGLLTSCTDMYSAGEKSSSPSITTVTTLALGGTLTAGRSTSVQSWADLVYSPANNIYVASIDYTRSNSYVTRVDKFTPQESTVKYVTSLKLEAYDYNLQYYMHEYQDIFFMATTDARQESEAGVLYAMKHVDGNNALTVVGEQRNLDLGGHAYETVRFVKNVAYLVGAREDGPLYTIDLSQPTQLRNAGQLKNPGFNYYLHPISEGRILGVGDLARTRDGSIGVKVTLFDVSDLSKPAILSTWSLPESSPAVKYDERGFLFWQPESVAILPVSRYTGPTPFGGAVVLDVSGANIAERGRVSYPNNREIYDIERNIVLEKTNLWSIYYDLAQVNNLTSLEVLGTARL